MKPALLHILFFAFRYLAAIVVSYVASVLTFMAVLWLGVPNDSDSAFWHWIAFLLPFFAVGFLGVLAGSFCLPQKTRWIGSLILLALGAGFTSYLLATAYFGRPEGASMIGSLAPLLPLTCGGLVPVLIHFRRRPKQE